MKSSKTVRFPEPLETPKRRQNGLSPEGIEELRLTLEELRASEETLRHTANELALAREVVEEERRRYHELFDFAPDGYFVTNAEGSIEEANRAAAALLGVRQGFVLGKPLVLFVAPELRAEFLRELAQARASSEVRILETSLQPRDGAPIFVAIRVTSVGSGNGARPTLRWLIRDVTESRHSQLRLAAAHRALQTLSGHLERVREEERTRIAREIHDEFGQALTGLKFDVAALAAEAKERPAAREKAREMLDRLDRTLEAVRRLSTELRPGVLDDLGLVAAAEWQAADFQSRTGIACSFESNVEVAGVDRHVATAAFRILQEALTNAARHADAHAVRIRLDRDSRNLILEIADDGRGVTERDLSDDSSLGLLGMRERGRIVGGALTIERQPSGGTLVRLRVPVESAV